MRLTLTLWMLSCTALIAQPQEVPPLEGALWQGEIILNINGELFNQYIANQRKTEQINDILTGFIKSKGSMNIDATYTIQFQINDLGETTFLLKESFKAKQEILDENHRQFNEERKVKRNRMTVRDQVNLSMKKNTTVVFERDKTYTNEVPFGNLEFEPSGRMNRKGSIQVKGTFNLMFEGDGEAILLEERTPATDELDKRQTTTKITRSFVLPVTFTATVKHRKDAETGQISVEAKPENPFSREGNPPWLDLEREAQAEKEKVASMSNEEREAYFEEKNYHVEKEEMPKVEGEREIFTPRLVTQGSFMVTPLFE